MIGVKGIMNYRPPSEAYSMLLQLYQGCSWNRCTFCSMYSDFKLNSIDQINSDIEAYSQSHIPFKKRVFLGDGNALFLKTGHLLSVLKKLEGSIPQLDRVAAYASARDILNKSNDELTALLNGNLKLLYIGIESGSNDILRTIKKGCTSDMISRAINRAIEVGFEVSATVVLGIGGLENSKKHISETVNLINSAPPTYLSTLSLMLETEQVRKNFLSGFSEFSFLSELDELRELYWLLNTVSPSRAVTFRSNHASNSFPLKGTIPNDLPHLKKLINRALNGELPIRSHLMRAL